MKTLACIAAIGVTLCPAVPALAGPYEDCILANMKGVQDRLAANEIRRACREKTTPKKCRGLTAKTPVVDLHKTPNFFDKFDLDECLKECADASYWSRKFGECSTD
jgi:hypothetical protein